MTNHGADIQLVPDADLLVYALPQEEQSFVMSLLEGATLTDSYLVASPGCTRGSAAVLGSRWFKRVRIRAAFDEMTRQRTHDAFRLLRAGQRKAIQVLTSATNGENVTQEQLRACLEVLDRTGVSSKHIIGLEATKASTDGFDGFLANCTKPST